jgi:hypothetical protein
MPPQEANMDTNKLADDMLMGAEAIAEELGISTAQVYHYARLKRLPIGKLGATLIASKRQLQRACAKLTASQD